MVLLLIVKASAWLNFHWKYQGTQQHCKYINVQRYFKTSHQHSRFWTEYFMLMLFKSDLWRIFLVVVFCHRRMIAGNLSSMFFKTFSLFYQYTLCWNSGNAICDPSLVFEFGFVFGCNQKQVNVKFDVVQNMWFLKDIVVLYFLLETPLFGLAAINNQEQKCLTILLDLSVIFPALHFQCWSTSYRHGLYYDVQHWDRVGKGILFWDKQLA